MAKYKAVERVDHQCIAKPGPQESARRPKLRVRVYGKRTGWLSIQTGVYERRKRNHAIGSQNKFAKKDMLITTLIITSSLKVTGENVSRYIAGGGQA